MFLGQELLDPETLVRRHGEEQSQPHTARGGAGEGARVQPRLIQGIRRRDGIGDLFTFLMMYSAYKLNKQGDNIQL